MAGLQFIQKPGQPGSHSPHPKPSLCTLEDRGWGQRLVGKATTD